MTRRRRNPQRIKHRNLSPEELPGPDSLIPIDAEFVAMQLVRAAAYLKTL